MMSRREWKWRFASVLSAAALILLLNGKLRGGYFGGFPCAAKQIVGAGERRPILFELNGGHFDAQYKAMAPGADFVALLASDRAVYRWRESGESFSFEAILRGARPSLEVVPEDPAGLVNYFIGNDPSKWSTDIPTYRRVRYHGVYPGIDVVFYGTRSSLEHDFIVAPGADPRQIRLALTGAEPSWLDSAGDLRIRLGSRTLLWQAPKVYQDEGGQRRSVAARYRIEPNGEVGFDVEPYDRGKPLVIDPVVRWATFLGGGSSDATMRAVVDSSGNVYYTGYSNDPNYPTSPGAYESPRTGLARGDAIITKVSSDGTRTIFRTHIGGSADDYGLGIALDRAGNVYITGQTDSDDFPTTPGAFQPRPGGGEIRVIGGARDCFVAKLGSAGNSLSYASYLGGNKDDICSSVAVDALGNAYITGITASPNFPVTEGAFQPTYRGSADTIPVILGGDAFVTKVNPTATALLYSTFLGGTRDEAGTAIAVDSTGSAYVTGFTNSAGAFPITQGALQTRFGGSGGGSDFVYGDAFVTKLNPAGSALVFSTYFGGNRDDIGLALILDDQNNIYLSGSTMSTDFPTSSDAYQRAFRGGGGTGGTIGLEPTAGDAFIAKIAASGASLVFSTYLGGSKDDVAPSLALDQGGNLWLAGLTLSSDFPVTQDAPQKTYRGLNTEALYLTGDAYVAQLDSMGRTLKFSTYLGGSGNDWGASVGVDSTGAVYVTGGTSSNDFPVTSGAFQTTYGGGPAFLLPLGDAFIVKYGDPPAGIVPSIGGVSSAASYQGGSVAPGEIVVVGGTNIGPAALIQAAVSNNAFPTVVGETRVLFDDIPAPMLYALGQQTSCIVPYAVAARASSQVVVEFRGVRSTPVTMPVVQTKPALFSANSSGRGQGAILNQDFTYNSSGNPAARGTIVQLFGTGEGQTDPPGVDGRLNLSVFPRPIQPVSVTVGDVPVERVIYAGAAPGAVAGLMQINVPIPPNVPTGDVPVVVFIGGARSQTGLTVSVR